MGSEEANLNNPKEWSRYQDGVGPGEYQPVQDMVEKDQQENKESQERLRRWTNTHQLTKLTGIWWKIDNRIEQIVVVTFPHVNYCMITI